MQWSAQARIRPNE